MYVIILQVIISYIQQHTYLSESMLPESDSDESEEGGDHVERTDHRRQSLVFLEVWG